MRLLPHVLALASLLIFGLSIVLDVALFRQNPCPLRFLFKLYLVLVGALGIPPALIGSAVATRHAAAGRR